MPRVHLRFWGFVSRRGFGSSRALASPIPTAEVYLFIQISSLTTSPGQQRGQTTTHLLQSQVLQVAMKDK
jgi:hypothetical protein